MEQDASNSGVVLSDVLRRHPEVEIDAGLLSELRKSYMGAEVLLRGFFEITHTSDSPLGDFMVMVRSEDIAGRFLREYMRKNSPRGRGTISEAAKIGIVARQQMLSALRNLRRQIGSELFGDGQEQFAAEGRKVLEVRSERDPERKRGVLMEFVERAQEVIAQSRTPPAAPSQ